MAAVTEGSLAPLLFALAGFGLTHLIPVAPPLRRRLAALLGERGYLIGYSLLSLAVLAWVARAYAEAPYVEIWPQDPLTYNWITLGGMGVAVALGVVGLMVPNPFSLGRGGKGYDPARPGLLRLTRHPVLWAVILWAGAHIPPNGDAASLLLFGLLFFAALPGPWLLDRKARRRFSPEEWRRLTTETHRPRLRLIAETGWRPIVLAGLTYAAILYAHPSLFGVSPWPL